MRILSFLIVALLLLKVNASAQTNLYIPDTNKQYLRRSPFEVGNSIYYLVVENDSSIQYQPILHVFLNRVDKHSALLQKSQLI
jgi:hypothetical protein